jgi:hypothetical protein
LADRASSLFEQYDDDGDGYIDEAEPGHRTLAEPGPEPEP